MSSDIRLSPSFLSLTLTCVAGFHHTKISCSYQVSNRLSGTLCEVPGFILDSIRSPGMNESLTFCIIINRSPRDSIRREQSRRQFTPAAERIRWDDQTTRSFPPSTGTCAPVVLAKLLPAMVTTISATSTDVISAPSRLLVLYSSTDKP